MTSHATLIKEDALKREQSWRKVFNALRWLARVRHLPRWLPALAGRIPAVQALERIGLI